MRKIILQACVRAAVSLLLLQGLSPVQAQVLKPGFDKAEYYELMLISVRTAAVPSYAQRFPAPARYHMLYQSEPMGLDNLWTFWEGSDRTGVISIRGTTAQGKSWLANLYAAMVPAQGVMRLGKADSFVYDLAAHPRAAVHVGWLLSLSFLAPEIVPRVREAYQKGTKDFLIVGHSQGGAIGYLLTAYLRGLQRKGLLPADIIWKTYCSAAPKPGNLYFAYDYEAATSGGWAFNVVNAADWVPETPISIQTLSDFNTVNPFTDAPKLIRKQKFPANLALSFGYHQLEGPARRAQRRYRRYLGNMVAGKVRKILPDYEPSAYYSSNNYMRAGTPIVLMPDSAYYVEFPDTSSNVFIHHPHTPYLYLLNKWPN